MLRSERINSEGQQFLKHQQNEQLPLTSSHLSHNRPRHMTTEIQVLASDRHKNVVGINRLIGSQPPHH